jgi:hypothetical protein
MNEINVIAPYKYHGQWVFEDPRVGLLQEPFVAGADTWLDRVVADIPGINTGLIGSARKAAATGIIRRTSIWKAGYVRRCSNISRRRQKRSMRRSKHGADRVVAPRFTKAAVMEWSARRQGSAAILR